MENEIFRLRSLLEDIIETLEGRDDSVKDWIIEQLSDIESTVE